MKLTLFSHHLPAAAALTPLLIAILASPAAASSFTIVTSASQLASNVTAFSPTTADVNATGAPASVGSVYSSSSVSFTTSDNTLTFSGAANGFAIDQVGVNCGDSAFATGSVLLGAGGFRGSAGGPVTITFAAPVSQFGVNLEDFSAGNYNVNFTAYDALGNKVAFITAAQDASLNGNDPGSLSSAGLYVAGDSIKTIVFDDLTNYSSSSGTGSDNLLFGNLAYLDAATPAPEPSALAFLTLGLLSTVAIRRRLLAGRVKRLLLPCLTIVFLLLMIATSRNHKSPSEVSGLT